MAAGDGGGPSGLREVELVRVGHRGNADIFSAVIAGTPVVVKDFSAKSAFVRALVGPFVIRRELKAYQSLAGVPGIGRVFDLGDHRRLAIERFDARSLAAIEPGTVSIETFRRLSELVAEVHSHGIVHLDLSHRGNILVTEDGRPVLIDLASCLNFSRLGRLGPWLARRIGIFDRTAVVKWKGEVCAEALSAREQRIARIRRLVSLAWILNPKPSEKA